MNGAPAPPPLKGVADTPRRHSAASLILLALVGFSLCLGFAALGTWQLYRRAWKLDLIERVQSRVHAPPLAPPGPVGWSSVTAASDAYRHVRVHGVLLNALEVRVQALTELGGGYWVVTPLRTSAGFIVLVNRGFVPFERAAPASRPLGQIGSPIEVTGLLRLTEPRGNFIQRNRPGLGLWYSRDVEAIAHVHGLENVAPYFIDADASPNPGGWPIGGLTVISFPNSHLIYAITWFSLALMVLGAIGFVGREEWRARRRLSKSGALQQVATATER